MTNRPKFSVHKDNICSFHSNVCATSHGHAYISSCQGGSVVNTVPHHQYILTLFLKGFHCLCLIAGEHIGDHMFNTRLGRNCLCSKRVVAREHNNIQTGFSKHFHTGRSISLQNISRNNGTQITSRL